MIVDDYEISGGGIITEALRETAGAKRSANAVTKTERRKYMNQVPVYVLCEDSDYAKLLERALFDEERLPYYAPGLSAEQIGLLLDAGMLVISDNSERTADYAAEGDTDTDLNRILMLTKAEL